MNMRDTDRKMNKLVDELMVYTTREIEAAADQNAPAVNRNVDQVVKRLEALKSTAEGRATLESLLSHHLAEVRLRAADRVLAWAPEKAIPVLGWLVAHWRPADPKKGSQPVAFDAAVSLFEHWGIRSYDRDDLVEPLAGYGITLERRA